VKLLLDTHAAVWFAEDDARLSRTAGQAIEHPDSVILLSAVVAWEMAIKRGVGKLPVRPDFLTVLLAGGVELLAITFAHVKRVESLPMHHRDPFDRLLVAQAQAEAATIVTDDDSIPTYDVPVLW
jgi:PIN domain nuclease of toxin-antitoxin system